ncbi:hypothetical protein [Bacillus sp. ISL-37]|nr:hypothetical protein [Bacillus sp. ISL-37]
MMDFIKKIAGKKSDSDCCGIEIKEVQENEEKKEDTCCGGDTSCC